ncbi:MAG TPA: prepilin peptidase [Fimbriimonadaceae bacterium]|nr:prepilin peptidase [Fimbriimonadaceae bacterium]HRJ32394.1 prepilin peptidase [Fimbriimonadaceae bacterium]
MEIGLFPAWTTPLGVMIGAAIGSFLNVVIYRLPLGMALSRPRHSFCPSCQHQLTGPDLIPLFSWLFLRGRCRHCQARVPSRYFVVELMTGAHFGILWHQHLVERGDPALAIAYAFFGAALIAAIFTDLRWLIIPDQINAAMFGIGVALNLVLIAQGRPEAWAWGIPSSLAGALAGIGVLWGIAFLGRLLFGKDAMGHGDIKMARGIGAVLGPTLALLSFGLAILLGAVFGVLLIFVRRALEARRSRSGSDSAADPELEEEPYEPETLGSLVVCGFGYLLLIDIWGLFFPRLYERWFGENPYATESLDDELEVEPTMIPFGPYLAMGALVACLMPAVLLGLLQQYVRTMIGE